MSLGLGVEIGKGAPLMLPQRIRSILNKYPSGDAHLYIPGAQIPVLGPELVVNGDFSNGTSGWGNVNVTSEVANNTITCTTTVVSGTAGVAQDLNGKVPVGTRVRISARIKNLSSTTCWLYLRRNAGVYTTYVETAKCNDMGGGVYSAETVVTSPDVTVVFATSSSAFGQKFTATEISVREVLSYTDRISNFSSGNFASTAGAVLYKVDQPVARVNDAARGLGPELVVNGDFLQGFAGWGLNGNVTFPAGCCSIVSTDGSYSGITYPAIIPVVGKTYRYSISVVSVTGSGAAIQMGGVQSPSFTVAGDYTGFITAINNYVPEVKRPGAGQVMSAVIDNISVREVIGNHATQNTGSSQPTLRRGAVNLLTYSQDFTSAVWQNQGTSGATRTPGIADPFGGTSAQKLTFPTTGNFISNACARAIAVGDAYTGSIWIRNATPGVNLRVARNDSGTYEDSSIGLPISAEWVRVKTTRVFTYTHTAIRLDVINLGGANATVEVYGAQLEVGPTMSAYSPTTTAVASNPDAGLYSWEFDGNSDYLTLDKPLFGMADDHCVIAGFKPSALTSNHVVFSTYGAIGRVAQIVYQSGSLDCVWKDDALVSKAIIGGSIPVGTSIAASARKVGSLFGFKINGVSKGSSTATLGNVSATATSIGYNGSNFFAGNIYPIIAIKGTVSDADLLTLETWVGKMSGVSVG